MAYTIDVYRGHTKVEKHFGRFALFVTFFPQLVAGPIERSKNLLHQFRINHKLRYENIKHGLIQFAFGMFKKVVIADRAAYFVNEVYNQPSEYYGFQVILATIFFAFQIYGDFSGYSDMAIGSARMMGFKLSKNFDRPYFANSIGDFWRRWHISLSTWLKDYIYIPAGGNRVIKWRWYFNLFLTFFVSGIWHGAAWTFVFFGLIHGAYVVYEAATKDFRRRFYDRIGIRSYPWLYNSLMISITFVGVCFAWIFFRANTLEDAFMLIHHMTVLDWSQLSWQMLGPNYIDFALCIFFITVLELVHYSQRYYNIYQLISRQPIVLRWSLYMILCLVIINFGVYNDEGFIYFQF